MKLEKLSLAVLVLSSTMWGGDWTDYRGPHRDGVSPEKGLLEKWDPNGQGLLWKAPIGGRSGPVVHGDRVYLLTPVGQGPTLQERVVALHATTGKVLWEYKYNLYLSDVPPHRIAWSSPAVDPETGNVYINGGGGTVLALSRDGKKLWERSLGEEQGWVTTHGGRTTSPIVEDDLVVVSGISAAWGEFGRAAHRYLAYDKKTGELVWTTAAPGRPFDTTYAPSIVADINGTKMLIGAGGDGAAHAMKLHTGELMWVYNMSKRGINTGPVVYNNTVFLSHSEENFDTNEMGLLAAVDALTAKGVVGPANIKWKKVGFQGGFSNPVIDGDRFYQVDNGSNLFSFDAMTGRKLWEQNLGTIQKSSPVLADGKLYVGTENGTFYILKPTNTGCEILDKDELGGIHGGEPITITGSPAVANGVVYVVTSNQIFAFGKPTAPSAPPAQAARPTPGAPAYLLVTPAEVILKPGESAQFRARLFDGKGNYIRDANAKWTADFDGTVDAASGKFTASSKTDQAGKVAAEFESLKGAARVRIASPLPFELSFDNLKPGPVPPYWVSAAGKYQLKPEGNGVVLAKLSDPSFISFLKRARAFIGQTDEHDYTIEADVRSLDQKRQMGDIGLVAQRYQLTLFGNHQTLELMPWQPEVQRTASVKFPWKGNTWYHLKLRVDNLPNGSVRARGKAWPTGEPEPAEWNIDRTDPMGNHQGSPGFYGDAPVELYLDNIKVTKNQ